MDGDGAGAPAPGAQRERGKACNTCNCVMWYVVLCNVICVLCMVVTRIILYDVV